MRKEIIRMYLLKLIQTSFFVLVTILSLTSLAFGGRFNVAAFRIVGQHKQNVDTLYCGFADAHSSFTYGVDEDTADMPQYGISRKEVAVPPLAPPVFNLHFIDSRNSLMLDQGIHDNFHSHTSSQDTFRILLEPHDSVDDNHPFYISWTLPNNVYLQGSRIKYIDPDDGPIFVDMLANSSLAFTKQSITKFDILTTTTIPLGVGDKVDNTPSSVNLYQNYPNPFNPLTTISFSLPEQAMVNIKVYNILGNEVATVIENKIFFRGNYNEQFDGKNLPSGVYYYRLSAVMSNPKNGVIEYITYTRPMILTK